MSSRKNKKHKLNMDKNNNIKKYKKYKLVDTRNKHNMAGGSVENNKIQNNKIQNNR
jgi:hypothetical protein